jgi:Ca-activated chloride channel family protein
MNESPNPSAAAIPSATLVLSPICAAYPQAGGTLDVLVRMKAPARPAEDPFAPTARRVPLRLALVVDRSGSMDGAPLTEALRCVNHIAVRLQPVDHLAVVLYDNHVQTPVPLRPATNEAAVAAALAGVESGGSTDLFAGWEQGARQLEGVQAEAAGSGSTGCGDGAEGAALQPIQDGVPAVIGRGGCAVCG